MCAIFLRQSFTSQYRDFHKSTVSVMNQQHRGPDSLGFEVRSPLILGHNRLSILDLSDLAAQPMTKENITLLFNGEIYNYKELKNEQHFDCESSGDTEVIIHLYQRYGKKAFKMLSGEFAIALVDWNERKAYFLRDPFGVKPLYFAYNSKGELIVSSEIRGILPHIERRISPQARKALMQDGYTTIYSLFEGIEEFNPGDLYEKEIDKKEGFRVSPYYSREIKKIDSENTYEEMKLEICHRINDSVRKRMISDVPISCTLSGGIDSSIIARTMKQFSSELKTYSIGFSTEDEDLLTARKFAMELGSVHTEKIIGIENVLDKIDEILFWAEEPFDKGSLVPTYFLAQLIEEKVTLIGEGADELFGGYARHERLWDQPEEAQLLLESEFINEIPHYHCKRIDKLMMSNSVEARVPYLDTGLVEFALSIPFKYKTNPRKKILREAYQGLLPDYIINREKKALKVPFTDFISNGDVVNEAFKGMELLDIDKNEAMKYDEKWSQRMWNCFLYYRWHKKVMNNL